MKHFIQYIIVIAVLSGCNQPGNESAKEGKNSETNVTKGDWVSLYNGKDFTGWHSYGGDTVGSAWKAEDSAIHLNVLQKKDWQTLNGGDLVTD